jgi:hypothetical protein
MFDSFIMNFIMVEVDFTAAAAEEDVSPLGLN